MDFEFISWISKWFRNAPSALRNFLQMTITSPFQLWFTHHLKCWIFYFPSFETIYSLYKVDSGKCSKFVLKFKVYFYHHILSSKFPCSWILVYASFPMFSYLLSYFIMAISYLPDSWYPCLAFFSWSMSLNSLISSFNLFFFSKSKVIQVAPSFSLEPKINLQNTS